MPYQAGSSAQRIRIGLTGLAFAFLLVLLGSIISRSSRDHVNNAAEQAAVIASALGHPNPNAQAMSSSPAPKPAVAAK